ncbi:DedA family protein [Sandaracinobacter neustonicus]|uniref:DedA family protein n=1 Tax=Sandaracinobacter neustonicus TaxID=1715348 RepID=A0A501XGS2_9SPHN|nr:YqaA family protein [Sandaracinobacter neustonicus]TPE59838.1 DedA family protein [Sandaracinobacter neustonicus]
MLRGLYNWTLEKCRDPRSERWLFGISFAEASFFPIPPDVLLAPMCLAQPNKAFRFAFICTLASVLGGLLGYAIGYFLFDTVGRPILQFYGVTDNFDSFAANFNAHGWLIVFLGGFITPLPFKAITIAAGATALPLPVLIGAAIVSRAGRFYIVAALLWKFGEPMQRLIDRYLTLLATILGTAIVGGFVAMGLLTQS